MPFCVLFDHFSCFDCNLSCTKDLYLSQIIAYLKKSITIDVILYVISAITVLLHLPDIWYLFHCKLMPYYQRRQMCLLLPCHYPMSLLCLNVCLIWMGQILNISFRLNSVVSPRNVIKRLQNFYLFLLCTFFIFLRMSSQKVCRN